jgi:Holliday junction resolvase RusA-like endonuclease
MRLAFVVDGTPKGKKRHRVDFVSGRVHEDAEGAKDEKLIADLARLAFGPGDPVTFPVRVTITAVFALPPSWPKRYHIALENGELIPHDQKPDKDNVDKLVLDALNEVVWRDDGQVSVGGTLKRYGSPERTEIVVERVLNPDGSIPIPTPSQLRRESESWADVLVNRSIRQQARKAAKKAAGAKPRPGARFRRK